MRRAMIYFNYLIGQIKFIKIEKSQVKNMQFLIIPNQKNTLNFFSSNTILFATLNDKFFLLPSTQILLMNNYLFKLYWKL